VPVSLAPPEPVAPVIEEKKQRRRRRRERREDVALREPTEAEKWETLAEAMGKTRMPTLDAVDDAGAGRAVGPLYGRRSSCRPKRCAGGSFATPSQSLLDLAN
jgi:hypothetical protein